MGEGGRKSGTGSRIWWDTCRLTAEVSHSDMRLRRMIVIYVKPGTGTRTWLQGWSRGSGRCGVARSARQSPDRAHGRVEYGLGVRTLPLRTCTGAACHETRQTCSGKGLPGCNDKAGCLILHSLTVRIVPMKIILF